MINDLKPYENVTRVFWIKIEVSENPRRGGRFHGEIRDAISGEKKSIKNLVDIIYFIIPYLKNMNIQVNWVWRIMKLYKPRFKGRSKTQTVSMEEK